MTLVHAGVGPEPGNFLLVLCFAFGSFVARLLLDRFVYKPLAMKLLSYKAVPMINDEAKWSKIAKCSESMWKLTYYAAVQIWVLSIIKQETWSLDTKEYFKGWPNQELKSSLILFYMCQCGFYVYSIGALVAWETRRKDFSIMMSHHIVTSVLIGFSYITRFFRIGTMILALHDTSDVFLESAKLFKYSEKEMAASLCFGLFAISWFLLRLVYFPFWIIKASSYECVEALSWMENFPTTLYYVFNTMLLTLLVFHTYWWKLIFAMIMKQMSNKGQVGEDIRSGSPRVTSPEKPDFFCGLIHDITSCFKSLVSLAECLLPSVSARLVGSPFSICCPGPRTNRTRENLPLLLSSPSRGGAPWDSFVRAPPWGGREMDLVAQGGRRARRRLLVRAVFLLYLMTSAHCLDAERAVSGRRKKKAKHEIKGPIKTLVVLVMENRSFDHMLGWLRTKGGRPDIDGLTGHEYNRLNASDPSSPEVFVSDGAAYVDSDPGHSFQAIREQIFGSEDTAAVPAPMSGFAQQAESMGEGMASTVMRGFAPDAVPVYSALAEEFAVFDRWFASVPASTQPNRFYVHSATSHGATGNVRRDLVHGFPQKTIFDSLDEDGLSFGVYYQNIPAVLFFKSLRKLKHLVKFHSYKLAFKLDAKLGRLPNYVVIEQHYFDVKLSPANDDHPSHDIARGQRLVKEVYQTLRASPQWNETALLITYDEHGGFYDHVPTPVTGVPNPDGIIGPDPFYFKFDRLGVRVPTILISPWIEKRTEKLPKVKSLRPFGPREDKVLSEFQVELIQLASQLNGDHVLNTYPYIGKGMTVRQANRYAEDAVARFLEAGRAALRAGANESAIVTMRPALTSRISGWSSDASAQSI
ncbi:Phosphoesterase family [Musa troglodytarum]|uniref:Phosphoesterase family n=1 Tax=Musa troglodytarum TaxID=320322 RepID=A0A9E7L990_9LILI|nr:Phosphoesterase family [Musa troglodytarum]